MSRSASVTPNRKRLTRFGELQLPVGLGHTFVLVGEAELGEGSTGDKETGSVGGSPVGQT